jgi:hypothetical protein
MYLLLVCYRDGSNDTWQVEMESRWDAVEWAHAVADINAHDLAYWSLMEIPADGLPRIVARSERGACQVSA